jgi:hypothetical protein
MTPRFEHPGIRAGAAVLGLALFSGGGCGDSVAPGAGTIDVTVGVCILGDGGSQLCPVGSVGPGQTIELTVTSVPSGDVDIRTLEIRVSGILSQVSHFSTSPGRGVAAVARDTLWVPLEVGTLSVEAIAKGSRGEAGTGHVTLAVSDTEPPVVESVRVVTDVMYDSIQPGVLLLIEAAVTDNAGLTRIVVRSVGDLAFSETVDVQGSRIEHVSRMMVPLTTPLGAAVAFEVVATDVAGLTGTGVSETRRVVDITPPAVSATLETSHPSTVLLPGDMLLGRISASDAHRLAWIGYRIGDPVITQDSVAVNTGVAELELAVHVAREWEGVQRFTAFARDSSGNVGWDVIHRQIYVYDAVRRPVRVAAVPYSVMGITFDPARDRLLLLRNQEVLPLRLGPMEYDPVMSLPDDAGANLVVMSDAVAVVPVAPYARRLAVIDLAAGTVDTLRLHPDWQVGHARSAAAAPGDRLFVTTLTGTLSGVLLEYDFATAVAQPRPDVGVDGAFLSSRLVSSGPGARLLLAWTDGTQWLGQVLDHSGGTFHAPVPLPVTGSDLPAASSDQLGNRFLLGGVLLGPSLATLRVFDMPSYPGYPESDVVSALGPDGEHAYFMVRLEQQSAGAIVKVRTSDGAMVERILLPDFAARLAVLPGGNRLVALGSSLMVVDLN